VSDPPGDLHVMPGLRERGALTLVESARLLGGYAWVETRLFEVTGAWVGSESASEARVFFDTQSRHHAWHAQLWSERIPTVDGVVDPDAVTSAPTDGTAALFRTIGAPDSGGGTLLRLVALARVVLPRLVCGYARHLQRVSPVSDAPVIRALRLALRDEGEAWRESELMVQALIRRPHDVAVVTGHQQKLEELVAGIGPGLVPWPETTLP
jgi:hypothetical protein